MLTNASSPVKLLIPRFEIAKRSGISGRFRTFDFTVAVGVNGGIGQQGVSDPNRDIDHAHRTVGAESSRDILPSAPGSIRGVGIIYLYARQRSVAIRRRK